jgi:hypothetical protein
VGVRCSRGLSSIIVHKKERSSFAWRSRNGELRLPSFDLRSLSLPKELRNLDEMGFRGKDGNGCVNGEDLRSLS